MKDITKKEMELILTIFKNPTDDFNANNISIKIGITPMGALKIMKRLEKQGILISKKIGKAVFYKINLDKDYVADYLIFLLKREAELSSPYIKRWINEARKINSADIAILFGSALKKESKANDIDILIVTDQKRFKKAKNEIEDINEISEPKLHAVYQTLNDLKENIRRKDAVVLSAIKGIIAIGYRDLIKILK